MASPPLEGDSTTTAVAGVTGTNAGDGAGVAGSSRGGPGVSAISFDVGANLVGGPGLIATSLMGNGVEATSAIPQGGGVPNGDGVFATGRNGVHGQATNSVFQPGPNVTAGVWGDNPGSGAGVKGTSNGGDGVLGFSSSNVHAGVSAVNDGRGFGLWASGTPAGHFQGNVEVTGDLCLVNQDCAEDFDISEVDEIDPGTVMVIEREDALQASESAYDRRVAGVISGAGDFRPGIILGKQQSQSKRMPIALLGKVYCKVDAGPSPIHVGDLLTTSPTRGHAMKAADPLRSFGAIIGKALRPLENGRGLIPILVALQ